MVPAGAPIGAARHAGDRCGFRARAKKNAAPAIVSRRRAAIAKIHRLLKLDNPVRTEEVNLATRTVFRGIRGIHLMPDAPHPTSVVRILKDRARDAGLDKTLVAKLSGHSMRVGAAQDMAAAGIDLGAIMHAGGWKSPDMVMRYIEHMDVQKSGMTRLYSTIMSEGNRFQTF